MPTQPATTLWSTCVLSQLTCALSASPAFAGSTSRLPLASQSALRLPQRAFAPTSALSAHSDPHLTSTKRACLLPQPRLDPAPPHLVLTVSARSVRLRLSRARSAHVALHCPNIGLLPPPPACVGEALANVRLRDALVCDRVARCTPVRLRVMPAAAASVARAPGLPRHRAASTAASWPLVAASLPEPSPGALRVIALRRAVVGRSLRPRLRRYGRDGRHDAHRSRTSLLGDSRHGSVAVVHSYSGLRSACPTDQGAGDVPTKNFAVCFLGADPRARKALCSMRRCDGTWRHLQAKNAEGSFVPVCVHLDRSQ